MKQPSPRSAYFKNNAGSLSEEPAGFLRVVWTSNPRQLSETQTLFTHMLHALQRNHWSRILINQVDMPPFSLEEQKWVAQEWLPLAGQTGYRYGAVVVSHNVMVRLATAYITTHVLGRPLTYRSFEVEAEATAWLLQQPNSPPQ
jgi:hypothetical protein